MPVAVSEAEIIEYYDHCHVDYEIVWHLDSKMCMHYGFWDETTPNLRSALVNMNVQVARFAGINEGDYVLDAGCGVGGSSFHLANTYGCRTEGITLSEKQVAYATEKSIALDVSARVGFSKQNFTCTSFPSNHFDVVWAIESVCHAAEKAEFLREAFRVLKPGGTLIVADFFSNEPAEYKKQEWINKWAESWAIPSFEHKDNFVDKAGKVGFMQVKAKDITSFIHPTARRLYYCFVPGIICDGFLRIFGKRTRMNKLNVWSTLYQYKCFKEGACSYYMVKAKKPW
jgi:tocopherol O-methyltransferase